MVSSSTARGQAYTDSRVTYVSITAGRLSGSAPSPRPSPTSSRHSGARRRDLAICVDAGGGHPVFGLSFHLRLAADALLDATIHKKGTRMPLSPIPPNAFNRVSGAPVVANQNSLPLGMVSMYRRRPPFARTPSRMKLCYATLRGSGPPVPPALVSPSNGSGSAVRLSLIPKLGKLVACCRLGF